MQHSVAHSKCCKDEQMRDSFSWSSAPGTDSLEFYDSVSSAAKRRIDTAESIHSELAVFFEHCICYKFTRYAAQPFFRIFLLFSLDDYCVF